MSILRALWMACFLLGAVAMALMAARTAPAADAAKPAGLIVFSSNRSGPWHIWTVKPDGTDLKELTKGPEGEPDVDPCWSPDGKQVLFSSTRGGSTGVWRMAADGAKPERICDGDQAEWSPDAKRIAFRRSEALFVRDLATAAEKRLTPADWPHCSGPAWSPDAKTLAFAARWDAANALYLVPADGGQPPQKLFDKDPACEPHWSPDGKSIVYETETHIAAIGADGKNNRLVTWFGGVQRYGRFSPDGQSIVFCQATERGPWELYIVPVAGGKAVRLTEEGSDMSPDWGK